jgi:hypothetical protein
MVSIRKTASKAKKRTVLVSEYLERISREVFSDFAKQLTGLTGKSHGVYALYKKNRLYYVGLATDLRKRIDRHLKDRHAGKWDRFSLYVIKKAGYIKELETLILRITDPTGTRVKGRLPNAKNLKPKLHFEIKTEQERRRRLLVGSKKRITVERKGRRKNIAIKTGRQPSLAPYTKKRFKIRANYKGKMYEASVRSDGTINYNGEIFNSPSMAGKAIKGRSTHGWLFWRYRNRKGDWVLIDKLRKSK